MHRLIEHLHRVGRPGLGGVSDGELLERFLAGRDEGAFAALLRRHGPMVLGVCRRVLRNAHDAADAFQATFLILARKAALLRGRGLLANWLYGVAYRAASEARRAAARRRARETLAARPQAVEANAAADLREVLDVELSRLPEQYRAAVVLCDLEGLTYQQAARRLGWPEGTVAGRLSRARALLAKRLARRGAALGAAGLAVVGEADGGVPGALAAATRGAALTAAGQAAPTAVSATALSLAQGVLRAMWWTKVKIAAAVLAVAAGVGVALLPGPAAADPAPPGKPADRDGKNALGDKARRPQQKTEQPHVIPDPRARFADPAQGEQAEKKAAPGAGGTREVEERLTASLSIDFKDATLREALDFLQERLGVNLVVDRPALREEGIDFDRPITLSLKRLPARVVLRHVLHEAGLASYVEDGVLIVTTVRATQAKLVRRVYRVGDLVGAGGKADNLIQVITKTVEPTTWAEQGGPATLAYFEQGRCLVVTQSVAVHAEVRQLLEELRAVRPDRGAKAPQK